MCICVCVRNHTHLVSDLRSLSTISYLNPFKSISVATGNTISRMQSPTSSASQQLQRKYHFPSVCRSFTTTLFTYLREKHARHVADLKAYYESEIQSLRDKLGLAQLPPDLEKSNRALELRSHHHIPLWLTVHTFTLAAMHMHTQTWTCTH